MRMFVIALLPLLLPTASPAATPVDSALMTTYTLGPSFQQVIYLTCGNTQETSGCYASGELGPFGHVGAIIEGKARESGNVVTREVYVIDTASGATANGVTLSVYKKTDTVTASEDTVEVSLERSVPLPLKGGAHASCYVAGNPSYLYIATNTGPTAVQVKKAGFDLTTITSPTPDTTTRVFSISASTAGWVTIDFGGESPSDASYVNFNAVGQEFEQGGGNNAFINSEIGLSTFDLPKPAGFVGAPKSAARAAAMADTSTTIPITIFSDYLFETDSETKATYNELVFFDCGSTPMSSGCFGSSTFGPFGNIGAVVGGPITWSNDTLKQHIYILDSAAGPHHTEVMIYDYLKTDVYFPASGNVDASAKLVRSASLPLTGSYKARAWLARSGDFLYAGTNTSTSAAIIQANTLASSSSGGFDPPVEVGSITINDYGYVNLVFAHASNTNSGFYMFNKAGELVGEGGGVEYVVNSLIGINAEALPSPGP